MTRRLALVILAALLPASTAFAQAGMGQSGLRGPSPVYPGALQVVGALEIDAGLTSKNGSGGSTTATLTTAGALSLSSTLTAVGAVEFDAGVTGKNGSGGSTTYTLSAAGATAAASTVTAGGGLSVRNGTINGSEVASIDTTGQIIALSLVGKGGGTLTLYGGGANDIALKAITGSYYHALWQTSTKTLRLKSDLGIVIGEDISTGAGNESLTTSVEMHATDTAGAEGTVTLQGAYDSTLGDYIFALGDNPVRWQATSSAQIVQRLRAPTSSGGATDKASPVIEQCARYYSGAADNDSCWGTYVNSVSAGTIRYYNIGVVGGADVAQFLHAGGIRNVPVASVGTCDSTSEGLTRVMSYANGVNDTRICLCGIDDTDDTAKWMNIGSGAWGDATTCPANAGGE